MIMEKNQEQSAKTYRISTMEQLLNVANAENIERLAIDFALYLGYYVALTEKAKDSNPELKDKLNTDLLKSTFVWVDDGRNDFLGVNIVKSDTGETTPL